jgi:hypothetical protein
MTHTEIIGWLEKHKDGISLQYKYSKGAELRAVGSLNHLLRCCVKDYEISIKPSPKKRLMTARELLGRWIRFAELDDNPRFITGKFMNLFIADSGRFSVLKEYEYCDDIRNPEWKSVEVEDV